MMLCKWLLPNMACKRAGMHYSMSFHPGLRLCAQWLKKLCQGGIKWKFWQAAAFRKFILRLFHLLLNHIRWRDYAFLNCVMKRNNSWYPIFKWCFLFFLISKLSFCKFLWKQTQTHSRTQWLWAKYGGRFWEDVSRTLRDLFEPVALSSKVLVQNVFAARYSHSYSVSFIEVYPSLVWTWNAPIGITFWFCVL